MKQLPKRAVRFLTHVAAALGVCIALILAGMIYPLLTKPKASEVQLPRP